MFTIISWYKDYIMSAIKRTLDQYWYEYANRPELHWMEQEHLNGIPNPKERKDNDLD